MLDQAQKAAPKAGTSTAEDTLKQVPGARPLEDRRQRSPSDDKPVLRGRAVRSSH